jgi:hypothetical protein
MELRVGAVSALLPGGGPKALSRYWQAGTANDSKFVLGIVLVMKRAGTTARWIVNAVRF